MRDGLKFRVTSEEIKKRSLERAEYHRTRAIEKESEIPSLAAVFDRIKVGSATPSDMATFSNVHKTFSSSSYRTNPDDVLEQLKADIRDHRNKSVTAQFIADHLFTDDYTLSLDEARTIGLIM